MTAWDRVNPRNGALQEARLDVATRDPASGRKIFVDVCVSPALTAAMGRVSRHPPARMGWLPPTPCVGIGLATHLPGVNLCHWFLRLAEGRLTRPCRSFAVGGWTWTQLSGLG